MNILLYNVIQRCMLRYQTIYSLQKKKIRISNVFKGGCRKMVPVKTFIINEVLGK